MPLLVLVVMPVAVGVAAALSLRDTRRASLAAALVSTVILYACLSTLNPSGEWTLLATFLVSPLTLAFALAAVLVTVGHRETPRRAHRA
jgi:protein-S-isoprenylcysteine O-methyltransferase Ste14